MTTKTKSDNFKDLFLEKWKKIKEPLRPSREEILFYETYVKKVAKNENPRMLILGSTPEFRDMALRHGIEPVSCDINKDIWEAMKIFVKEKGKEQFLHMCWLTIPETEKYDIIIGDGAINMLSDDQADAFSNKISKLVKDDGYIIQRIATSIENLTVDTFDKAMQDYRKNKYPMSIYLYTVLLNGSINSQYYPDYTRKQLFEKVLSKYLLKEEIEELKPYMMDKKFFFPIKQEVEKLMKKYFKIIDINESKGTGYWGTAFQYILQS